MNANEVLYIDFPLKGHWNAPNTPGDKIPSHGSDALGQTYAIDLYRTDLNNTKKIQNENLLKLLTIGVKTNNIFCYNENIYSPLDGEVVTTYYKCKDPKRVNPIFEILKLICRSIFVTTIAMFVKIDQNFLSKFVGNYIIIKHDNNLYSLFAHLSQYSNKLKTGDKIKNGQVIGKIGHTGNSTAPHLHFQLMDSSDLLKAKGIQFKFKKYYKKQNNTWIEVLNDVPKSNEIISLVPLTNAST